MKHKAEQFQFGGFFKDKEVKVPEDKPWKKSETDKMLNMWLAGKHPNKVGRALDRDPKDIKRRIRHFVENTNDRAVLYVPFQRYSRREQRWTENERELIRIHTAKQVPSKATARVLQRDLSELGLTMEQGNRLLDMKRIGVGVDLVLAYRYLYYVCGISILPDVAYDALEKEEMEFGACGDLLKQKIGSDIPEHYPHHIRALALYLAFKYGERKKEGQ